MKMRSATILFTLAICISCGSLSPVDKAMEQISHCVAENKLDSLAILLPSLRLSVSIGDEVIARAEQSAPEVLGTTLVVAKPPREAATIFVNMLTENHNSVCANASDIARQVISCYKALNLNDECDTFVQTVDETTLQLPVNIQAKVITGCTTPDKLGSYLKQHRDSAIIEAVRNAYRTDPLKLKQFNQMLN